MNKQGKGKIEYLDYTFNPVSGCNHPCKDSYCYARKIAKRFGGWDYSCGHIRANIANDKTYVALNTAEFRNIGCKVFKHNSCKIAELEKPYLIERKGKTMKAPYPFGFIPTFHRYRLDEPQKIKKPSIIGVVYMGDLFGEWVPDEWIQEVFKACEEAPQHTYMFLTKNPLRYGELNNGKGVPDKSNFWYGSTVTKEGDPFACIKTPRLHRSHYFISIEPLLEVPADLSALIYADWIIIGQQTNPNKPPKPEWVQSIIDQCREANVPVFVKSPLYQQFPIQEFPEGLRKEMER